MSQLDNTRMLRLQQISIDLRGQMAEVHKLRNSLQLAESARHGKRPTNGRVVNAHEAQSNDIALEVSEQLSSRSRATFDLARSLRSGSKSNLKPKKSQSDLPTQ
jgi:hypothetical protein